MVCTAHSHNSKFLRLVDYMLEKNNRMNDKYVLSQDFKLKDPTTLKRIYILNKYHIKHPNSWLLLVRLFPCFSGFGLDEFSYWGSKCSPILF